MLREWHYGSCEFQSYNKKINNYEPQRHGSEGWEDSAPHHPEGTAREDAEDELRGEERLARETAQIGEQSRNIHEGPEPVFLVYLIVFFVIHPTSILSFMFVSFIFAIKSQER